MEYFSPPKVERVDSGKGVRSVQYGRRLPWQPGVLDPPRDRMVWRHTVYAGIFDISKVREVLQNVLRAPDSEDDLDGRVGGQSALLSFAVDDRGLLFKESITLSSCAWAVSRTLTPGPESDAWLTGFEEDQARLLAYLFEIGDGRIRIEPSPEETSRAGRWPDRIAGASARLAIDVVTGGIAALPAVASLLAGPAAGPIGTKFIEKVGDAVADDVNSSIEAAAKGTKDGGGAPGNGTAEYPPSGLGTEPLTVDHLAAITRWVAETLGVAEVLQPNAVRVKSTLVPLRSADDVSSEDFLNSFYADDLERVAGAIEAGDAGAALREYLRPDESVNVASRTNLRDFPRTVLRCLAPESMPLGRWPGKPDEPLALSQQFAVNEILRGFRERGAFDALPVYAVNGPPGTGKTTMLRDLIAALVVERAGHLADLESARDAFGKYPLQWDTEETAKSYTRKVYPLKPQLTGFEMVVASSNNGAVENVTLEVPAKKAIDPETFPGADYLSDPVTLLTGEPCWGAIAARLGKRKYRRRFVQRFWWGNDDSDDPDETERAGPAEGKPGPAGVGGQELRGLQPILQALKSSRGQDDADETLSWKEAKQRFTAAVDEVRRLARERQEVADVLQRAGEPDDVLASLRQQASGHREYATRLQAHRAGLVRDVATARDACRRAGTEVSRARDVLARADEMVGDADARVRDASARLHDHAEGKPGILQRLWRRNALRTWEGEGQPLARALDAADRLRDQAEEHWYDCNDALAARRRDLNDADQAERHARARLAQCEREIRDAVNAAGSADQAARNREETIRSEAECLDRARSQWPGTLPGDEWNAGPEDRDAMEKREKSSPWMDEEFAAARSRVFLAALDLYRAVLTAEPKLMWDNLRAAIDVVNGDAPADLPAHKILAAWQMIFFVVPVISTTFASVPRMFAALGREALGWLFIDEAGQSTPQAAVGALWRSRRAVVVGDPLQLEPVVTLPWSGQKRLSRQFGVDPRWAPQSASVQTVADRLNPYGTWLPGHDGEAPTWVGSPLRVHRRCDRLMFEVSNAIAYDGMMVYGVTRDDSFETLKQSMWLHVPARPSGPKWNPEEGRYVAATLDTVVSRIREQMRDDSVSLAPELVTWANSEKTWKAELIRRVTDSIFVISPFRDVVHELKRVARRKLPAGVRDRVGTVHTTQGKEADIVIVCLGTPADADGSREWAAKRPNLLNVAVTRARRRLIVIGDYGNWSGHDHFRELAQHKGGLLTVMDAKNWRVAGQQDDRWSNG